jgi:hypothetical protein
MTQVRLLTESQKDALQGKQYRPNCWFNPIQDINDNWVISNEEVNMCNIAWVKELPIIDYAPKPEINPFEI